MSKPETSQDTRKPGLLVLELWGLGDLALAIPFLRLASEHYSVSVLGKPHAVPLLRRLCPDVRVIVFEAPWTVFRGKYRMWSWPWKTLRRTLDAIRSECFSVAVSARSDPRDHLLAKLSGVPRRLGFPRLGSGILLTQKLPLSSGPVHRYERWRAAASELGLRLPDVEAIPVRTNRRRGSVLVHTGAARLVRVWPLERYAELARRIRQEGYSVRVACDPAQADEWTRLGEAQVAVPTDVEPLLEWLESGAGFIGNDSGPGHLAAVMGLPTFTIFGPQLPELFLPIHPKRAWVEGKACPFKPCFDSCRFPQPDCILGVQTTEVTEAVMRFLRTSEGGSG